MSGGAAARSEVSDPIVTIESEAPKDPPEGGITVLLREWSAGNREAGERLFDAVYPELKKLARQHLSREPALLPFRPTELVNEVYLRLANQRQCDWQSRTQFFALAATFIRRILVDQAKHRLRGKRGQGTIHLSLDDVQLPVLSPNLDLLALDRALVELAGIRMAAARIVELRYFAGLSLEETADALGASRATVLRTWRFARAWLGRKLGVV